MARDIIEIDREKCTGCGLCIKDCAEGALAIVNGKAEIISDVYCDGLGACLGACPEGALRIIKRDAPDFNEEEALTAKKQREGKEPHVCGCAGSAPKNLQSSGCGCPGSAAKKLQPLGTKPLHPTEQGDDVCVSAPSALGNWPIQLALMPPTAPYLKNASLLVAADCVGFALSRLHESFLAGKVLMIGCPKLDNAGAYAEKLAEIIKINDIKDITVLHMSVPCCRGMAALANRAIELSGADITPKIKVITPDGSLWGG